DHRAFFTGHALANQSGEGRGFLTIEVGFEAVADRFVRKDSGPAGTEHHFHVSGRSFAGIELQDGLTGRLFREEFGRLFTEEEIESDAASAARGAAAGTSFGLGDAGDVYARQRLRVFGKSSVGTAHKNVAQFVGVVGTNFFDAGIEGAGGVVCAHEQFDFGGDLGINGRQGYGIQTARGLLLESGHRGLGGRAGDKRGGAGGVENALGRKIVGVSVAGALSGDNANAA